VVVAVGRSSGSSRPTGARTWRRWPPPTRCARSCRC